MNLGTELCKYSHCSRRNAIMYFFFN